MTRERDLFAIVATTSAMLALTAPGHADVTGPGGKTIECYCTDRNGGRVEMGETICLTVGGRMFTAQCQMSLNSPMWRELEEGCATSSLPQTTPSRG